jgi:transcriptional regulator with XRE-family HTH domain
MNFGSNLQYLRMIHQNMTQEELASQLNVSRQTISKWELNQGNPELGKLQEICTLFNCTADDILFGNMRFVSEAHSEIAIEKLRRSRISSIP